MSDDKKLPIIICDMDGTLCNSAHREHLARQGEWDMFHSMLIHDKPHEDVKLLLGTMQSAGHFIVGLTGRNEKWRAMTMDWLTNNTISLDDLVMRPDNDFSHDVDLKPRMLFSMFKSEEDAKENIMMILEDRDKMVERWRNLGFRCWQPQPGGY